MNNSDVVTYHKLIDGNPIYDEELRTAPWLIDINDFATCDDLSVIEMTLDEIKKKNVMLVLASPSGERYGNTILIDVDDEIISIDRPNGFDEETRGTFRIFFKDISEAWCFFEVEVISECTSSLCSSFPEVLYRLQQRKKHRVDVPENTRAVFWQKDVIHNGGHVRNLSSAGMLLCTECQDEKFAEDTTIHNIAIALPQHEYSAKSDGDDQDVLPIITNGKIVRSFREEETGLVCHGVSFSDGDDVISEIEKFVEANIAGKVEEK